MNGVETLIIPNGGKRDKIGYFAGDIEIFGIPSVGYSMLTGVNTPQIKRTYIYTDTPLATFNLANNLLRKYDVEVIGPDEAIPSKDQKYLRVVHAEKRLTDSLNKTFYDYIINDIFPKKPFKDDWKSAEDIIHFLKENPRARQVAFAVLANDAPLTQSKDLEAIIKIFNPSIHDTLIGYTKKQVLDNYLRTSEVTVDYFHDTMKNNDFIDGEYKRHNGLDVVKWGAFSNEFVNVISFYNHHRYQSDIRNYIRLIGKVFQTHPQALRYTGTALWFSVGKYFNSFNVKKIREKVTKEVNNDVLMYASKKLLNHSIALDSTGSGRSVLDIDVPEDKIPIRYLMEKEKIHETYKI